MIIYRVVGERNSSQGYFFSRDNADKFYYALNPTASTYGLIDEVQTFDEYEEIEALEQKLADTQKLLELAIEALELAIEALEFYGDKKNWVKQNQKKATRNNVTDCSFIRYGGERAIQALERIKEIER